MKTLQKGKGEKGRVWGKERGKVWDEVKMLRKEWVATRREFGVRTRADCTCRSDRYRTREAKVVKNVVAEAQVGILLL